MDFDELVIFAYEHSYTSENDKDMLRACLKKFLKKYRNANVINAYYSGSFFVVTDKAFYSYCPVISIGTLLIGGSFNEYHNVDNAYLKCDGNSDSIKCTLGVDKKGRVLTYSMSPRFMSDEAYENWKKTDFEYRNADEYIRERLERYRRKDINLVVRGLRFLKVLETIEGVSESQKNSIERCIKRLADKYKISSKDLK